MGIKNTWERFWGGTTLVVHSDDDGYGEMIDKMRDVDIQNGAAVLDQAGVEYENVPAGTTVIDFDTGLGGFDYSDDVAQRASDAVGRALYEHGFNERVID